MQYHDPRLPKKIINAGFVGEIVYDDKEKILYVYWKDGAVDAYAKMGKADYDAFCETAAAGKVGKEERSRVALPGAHGFLRSRLREPKAEKK